VRNPKGEAVTSANATKPGMAVGIDFHDGRIGAVIDGTKTKNVSAVAGRVKTKKPKAAKTTKPSPKPKNNQGDLF